MRGRSYILCKTVIALAMLAVTADPTQMPVPERPTKIYIGGVRITTPRVEPVWPRYVPAEEFEL